MGASACAVAIDEARLMRLRGGRSSRDFAGARADEVVLRWTLSGGLVQC